MLRTARIAPGGMVLHVLERANGWARILGKAVDFRGVATAGGCRVSLDGKNLLVTPLPSTRGPKFAVRLLPAALPWKLPEATHVETLDESGKVLARQPIRRDGAAVLLDCEAGVFAYRLVRER